MIKTIVTKVSGVLACAVFIMGIAGAPAKSAIIADIIWIIDDSISMGGDIAQVRNRILQFDTEMTNAGIDANYGLVRFGGNSGIPASYSTNSGRYGATDRIATMEHQLSDFAAFASGFLSTMTAPTRTQEPGSKGVVVAFDEINFRAGSVKNIILVTDEDDDSSNTDFLLADQLLTDNDALFNFIGVPGTGNTNSRYGQLAADHGGAAFNIASFRSDPDPFFDNFTATKVQEILIAVPEPGMAAIFGLGFAGFVTVRRRSRK